MKLVTLILLILSIVLISCKQEATEPETAGVSQNIIDFGHTLTIALVYYDSIQVEIPEPFLFGSEEISLIEIGMMNNFKFQQILSIVPDYVPAGNSVSLFLNEGVGINPELREVDSIIRLYAKDSQYYDRDTLIQMYKYPYPNAEIFLTYEEIFYRDPIGDRVHEFDFKDSLVYIHALGPHGIILKTGVFIC